MKSNIDLKNFFLYKTKDGNVSIEVFLKDGSGELDEKSNVQKILPVYNIPFNRLTSLQIRIG